MTHKFPRVVRRSAVLRDEQHLADGLALLEGVGLGLVSGNIAGGARLKLGSAGLWDLFEVGSYGSTEEVMALARVAARHRGFYISHIRDEADRTLDRGSVHHGLR